MTVRDSDLWTFLFFVLITIGILYLILDNIYEKFDDNENKLDEIGTPEEGGHPCYAWQALCQRDCMTKQIKNDIMGEKCYNKCSTMKDRCLEKHSESNSIFI